MPRKGVQERLTPRGCIGLAATAAMLGLAGCSPEGTGTIKLENPEGIRAKAAGAGGDQKPATAKQAKALQLEEEAAKKHPKLR